jgi:hypothetical protein
MFVYIWQFVSISHLSIMIVYLLASHKQQNLLAQMQQISMVYSVTTTLNKWKYINNTYNTILLLIKLTFIIPNIKFI